jgi:phosphinothricin acetyltransferase
MTAFTIRNMEPADWSQVGRIYEEGIATGYATFETRVPTYTDWDAAHVDSCRFIAESAGKILGCAALSPVSGRCVYGGVAEVSVYVGNDSRGKGVGQALMKALVDHSESEGFWTLQAGIFPENRGSIGLHEKMGFRFLGRREKIGKLNGVWYDNLIFERRSKKVGLD